MEMALDTFLDAYWCGWDGGSVSTFDLLADFNTVTPWDHSGLRELGWAIWCCSDSPSFSMIDSTQWWLGCCKDQCFLISFLSYTRNCWMSSSIIMEWDMIPYINSWQIKQCCGHLILVSGGCLDEVSGWGTASSTKPRQFLVPWRFGPLWY